MLSSLANVLKFKKEKTIMSHLIVIIIFSLIYHYVLEPKDFSNGETLNNYMDTLYFTMVTHSTLGYGDIYPKTKIGRLFITCHIAAVLVLIL